MCPEEYIAAGEEFGGPDLGRVVRAEAPQADLDRADRHVEQQQRRAQRQQRAQRVLPPGAPAEPAGDHGGGGAALAEHDVVVEEGMDSRPLLIRPEEHDLPVQGHQPGRDQHGNDDGEIERQRSAEERDAVTTHPRWLDLRRFRLPVQAGEDVGTHPIDVTASECGTRSIRSLCDDDVMWTMSQRGLNS